MSTISAMPVIRITRAWWPLAASWLLMGVEVPLLSAVVARLANPEINLAAYGGVVFPLALIIEAPIIMLLPASTALSKDIGSYRLIYRFMMVVSACLTALHILVAFTPLYYLVVEGLLSVPAEIVEPARVGLMIMTPWTWSIAYRRFNQGVMIRFGNSKAVGVGTVIRLVADLAVLGIGYSIGSLPGIVVAASAVAAGVISEAIYAGLVVRPILHTDLLRAQPVKPALTLRSFMTFYWPLVLTSLLMLLANPLGSAGLSRMPNALISLAVWSPLSGVIFIFRSFGIAFNEIVVALLDEPHSVPGLRSFSLRLSLITTAGFFVFAVSPLSAVWFSQVSALPAPLSALAQTGLWLALPLPALSVAQSWFQGSLMHGRATRSISQAIVVYLFTFALVIGIGIVWGQITGLYVGVAALSLSVFTQTIWLWYRSQPIRRDLMMRDQAQMADPPAEVSMQ
jgi:hypothetical protein